MSQRLTRALRPLAVLGVMAAVVVTWKAYHDNPSWHEQLPYHFNIALAPIYAIWRPPGAEAVEAPLSRVALDLWNSPVLDRLVLAALVATLCATVVAWASARRIWTPLCLMITVLAVLATNVAIARVPDGNESFVGPFRRAGLEYFPDIGRVNDDPVGFIQQYPRLNATRRIGHHPGTHPPGGILFLWAGHKLLDAPPAQPTLQDRFDALMGRAMTPRSSNAIDHAAWLAVIVTALGVVPTWLLARTVGGAAAARRVLPLYVVAPNLVLFGATSMDGVFLVCCVSALAAGVATMRRGWSPIATPLLTSLAGVMLWIATFMTFAALAVPVLMVCYALCVLPWRPMFALSMLARCVLVGVVFLACQWIAWQTLGYDLSATVHAAMTRDYNGLRITGYESFALWRDLSIGNAFAFVIGSGIAVSALAMTALAVSLSKFRSRSTGIVPFTRAAALSIALLAMSTLFTLETERVWMFLTPAVLIAATTQFRGIALWTLLIAASLTQVFWIETQYYVYW